MSNFVLPEREPKSPIAIAAALWSRQRLIIAMAKREIEMRYKGSVGGIFWYVINNLALLAIYSFVFGVVFKARWQSAGLTETQSSGQFAIPLFVGMLVFNVFADSVNRAPTLITSNVNYVKKVVFPLEILPVVSILTALFNAAVGILVLAALSIILGTPISWKVVYFPLAIFPVVIIALGASWFLASIGVFVRDAAQIVTLCVTVMMFLTPIFYPAEMLPTTWQAVLQYNPMAIPVEQARLAIVFGQTPNFLALGFLSLGSFIFLWIGWLWFQLTRKGFADVI